MYRHVMSTKSGTLYVAISHVFVMFTFFYSGAAGGDGCRAGAGIRAARGAPGSHGRRQVCYIPHHYSSKQTILLLETVYSCLILFFILRQTHLLIAF